MKLFVFEGDRDSSVFDTLITLFFSEEKDASRCVYGNDIYSLYRKLKSYETFDKSNIGNTFSVLKEILKEKQDNALDDLNEFEISEIYLFFDYDFQQKYGTLKENNKRVGELLEYFDEETESGKLYIHYPMLESIRYTKELPDVNYCQYVVSREDCRNFKNRVQEFSHYGSFDHIQLPANAQTLTEKRKGKVLQNWEHLIRMNVEKAHFLCCGTEQFPIDKQRIKQGNIYENQLHKYVEKEPSQVSVLNAFPLFLYEYFKVIRS